MLKAFAARRERWDLRCSLKLPLAVYIFPQKSHLCKRFLESENQQLLSNLYSSPVWLFPAVASDMIVVVAGSGKALTTHVTGVRFLTCNKGSGEQVCKQSFTAKLSHTSVQADVVHQANTCCQDLVAMWTFQLLASSLQWIVTC